MSRGLGTAQRTILAIFEHNPGAELDAITLAGLARRQDSITRSEAVSFRRAARGLVERGSLVDLGRGYPDGRRRYALGGEGE